MKKILLPVIILGFGVAGGVVVASSLPRFNLENCFPADAHEVEPPPVETEVPTEFVKLNNQFLVPVISDERVKSLVVMSLSLEVTEGTQETVFLIEPRLRDILLRVLFEHANQGGFDGAFTSAVQLDSLREKLRAAGRDILGETLRDVLIVDVARQDN